MKITLDLKDFEKVLHLGVNSLFKENVNITEIITPFAAFHINNESQKKIRLLDICLSAFDKGNFIEAIKQVHRITGCSLKEGKDFCDKLRSEETFRTFWLNDVGDAWVKMNWKSESQNAYFKWLSGKE